MIDQRVALLHEITDLLVTLPYRWGSHDCVGFVRAVVEHVSGGLVVFPAHALGGESLGECLDRHKNIEEALFDKIEQNPHTRAQDPEAPIPGDIWLCSNPGSVVGAAVGFVGADNQFLHWTDESRLACFSCVPGHLWTYDSGR